jgi:hypothetical protein
MRTVHLDARLPAWWGQNFKRRHPVISFSRIGAPSHCFVFLAVIAVFAVACGQPEPQSKRSNLSADSQETLMKACRSLSKFDANNCDGTCVLAGLKVCRFLSPGNNRQTLLSLTGCAVAMHRCCSEPQHPMRGRLPPPSHSSVLRWG